jgi:hypothetical protein
MKNVLRIVALAVIVAPVVAAALYRPAPVFARPSFLCGFRERYPDADLPGSKLTEPPTPLSCASPIPADHPDCTLMCHRTGRGSDTNLSFYGLHFRDRLADIVPDGTEIDHATADQIDAAFQRIETRHRHAIPFPVIVPLDSDGDGVSNLDEINEFQTYPGDPNDRPRLGDTVTGSAVVMADSAPAPFGPTGISTTIVNTPLGAGVTVQPLAAGGGGSPVTLTFSNVVAAGNTQVAIGGSGPAAPAGFDLGAPPTYYNVTTTAVFTGPVAICIDYTVAFASGASDPRLFHHEGGAWADVTTSADPVNRRICGGTLSLSPFTVAAQSDFAPPVTTAVASATAWTNAGKVTVSLSAVDEGGAGVKEVAFILSGAQTGAGVISGDAGVVEVFAEGLTTLTYFARDAVGNAEDPRTIEIRIDRTPPVLSGLPAADCILWPANHQLVRVAAVTASDALSGLSTGSPRVRATSSEPDDARGDGRTRPDVVIEGGVVWVRAERSGAGVGRRYDIRAAANDLAGNMAEATATCVVPHDRGRQR